MLMLMPCDSTGYVYNVCNVQMESVHGVQVVAYTLSQFSVIRNVFVGEIFSATHIAFFPPFRSHITVKSNTTEENERVCVCADC